MMKSSYKPPFTITSKIVSLVGDISELVGALSAIETQIAMPKLRKENFVKTITGTLEIEGNTLGAEKITAMLDGKRVLGSVREIAEVKGAITVYEKLGSYRYKKEGDLLLVHKELMSEILKNAGSYRKTQVGVGGANGVTHIAPPADRVPQLMGDLFAWLDNTTEHPLIVSSVFHYEFEFIHPFIDGNGRMGRLWQTLILREWKSFFEFVPIESVVRERQRQYYEALENGGVDGESTVFIEFMLECIFEAVSSVNTDEIILQYLANNPKATAAQMADFLHITVRAVEKQIAKLKAEGQAGASGEC